MEKQWLSKKEAAMYLGISIPTLDRYMEKGRITYYKTSEYKSGKVRFRASDLEKFLRSSRVN